ncbi:MAG: hypothetical protein AAF561_10980 [Planctomycetota bacterium]
MELENFEQALKDYRSQVPFKPYYVELVSGRIIRVDHPEALYSRAGQAVFLASNGAPSMFDYTSVARIFYTAEEPEGVVTS